MTEIRASTVLPARRAPIDIRTADGLTLVGELALPADRDPVATLICLHPLPTHGGMMDSHLYRKASNRLPALADLAVLRFNTRGTESERGRRLSGRRREPTGLSRRRRDRPARGDWPCIRTRSRAHRLFLNRRGMPSLREMPAALTERRDGCAIGKLHGTRCRIRFRAGAKILGNIEVGRGAKVGAGSVVLRDVPEHVTVAGIPARVVGRCAVAEPALEMDATFPWVVEGGGGL